MHKALNHFLRDHRRHAWLLLVLSVGALVAILFQALINSAVPTRAEESNLEVAFEQESEHKATYADLSLFTSIELVARAAFVADLTNGQVLFSKNEQEKLPLASVTKLMTALVAQDSANNNFVLTLTQDDLKGENGGGAGLRVGERWKLGDMIDVMLLMSSNDGAYAVGRFIGGLGSEGVADLDAHARFVGLMNARAEKLGLSSMQFLNESGLDISESLDGQEISRPGALGSARDVAVLMATLWQTYPQSLEITRRKDARIVSQDGLAHVLINTNTGMSDYPGMLGSKTGFTSLAGGNLVIIFDIGIGHPVVASVLGSTIDGRFEDMKKLVDATLQTFSK